MVTVKEHPEQKGTVTISVKGKFDFGSQQAFRGAYENLTPNTRLIVDLRETTHMDSAAMGMLMVMRDYFGADNAKSKIEIHNINTIIGKMMDIFQFNRYFKIEI